jgi:HNH endonuclease
MLPGRAGQPTQIQVHMSLSQLRDLPGASAVEVTWAAARTAQPGWLTGPEADAAACDASAVPIVIGHIDPIALDYLAEVRLATTSLWTATAATSSHVDGADGGASPAGGAGNQSGTSGGRPGTRRQAGNAAGPAAATDRGCLGAQPLSADTQQRLRRALLALAADALSGPGGLAAQLRTTVLRATSPRAGLDRDPLASVSLPLDIGPATETIPAHLRRAVTARHPHCAFPGCAQPASVCEVHHIIPRSRGGPTSLANLVTMCTFHHKIVVHRWGWMLRLNSDGTTTAASPDGRTLHSHGPPRQAA